MKMGQISILATILTTTFMVAASSLDAIAATATGTASATVIRDRSFSVTCDALSFGNILKAKGPGIITVSPEGKRKKRGRVRMGNEAHKASTCQVSGPANTTYTARAPWILNFSSDTPSNNIWQRDTLRVAGIRIKSKNLRRKGWHIYRGKSDSAGRDELYIGATLFVRKNATPGTYRGVIPITIHY